MSGQISDIFTYREGRYSIARIDGSPEFDPELLGITVGFEFCSACTRGYRAEFGINERRLILKSLHLIDMPCGPDGESVAPMIDGTAPQMDSDGGGIFAVIYDNLAWQFHFTGGILIADGFIAELYSHGGTQSSWKYERIVALTFENGILVKELDRSETIAELRSRILMAGYDPDRGFLPDDDALREFVTEAYRKIFE